MSKSKYNRDQFIDKETDSAIYGDYLPVDIIRNEIFLFDNNKVKIEFILWKPMDEEQERTFLKELRNAHKDEIINIRIMKAKEHYIIEAKTTNVKKN